MEDAKSRLETLYREVALVEIDAAGLAGFVGMDLLGDFMSSSVVEATARSPTASGGSFRQRSEASGVAPREKFAGFNLSAAEARKLENYIVRMDGWREHFRSQGDEEGRARVETYYVKALEYLLANQHTELELKRTDVGLLRTKLDRAQSTQRDEVERAINDALQTPMQLAADTIISLIKKLSDDDNDEAAIPLAQVLKQISSGTDMYQPKMLNSGEMWGSAATGGGGDAQRWMADTFAGASGHYRRNNNRRNALVAPASGGGKRRRARRASVVMMTLQNFAFDQFDYEEAELPELCREFFQKWDLLSEFKVPVPVFNQFVATVRNGYHDHPYHNFRHAFDVCQMMYCFLSINKASEQLAPLEMFVLLISALVHDIDHNALNNNFHINSQSPLALLYNDISVLENHHCSYATKLLARTENNLFANLDSDDHRHASKILTSCILATDMSNHFDVTNQLKVRVDATSYRHLRPPHNQPASYDPTNDQEDRQILMNVLMHSADLSNPVRPFPIAKKWAYMIIEEFAQQGDTEKRLSLPVSPMCDRKTLETEQQKAKMQVDFLDYVIAPMFSLLTKVLTGIDDYVKVMKENRGKYKALANGVEVSSSPSVSPRHPEEEEEEEPAPQPEPEPQQP